MIKVSNDGQRIFLKIGGFLAIVNRVAGSSELSSLKKTSKIS